MNPINTKIIIHKVIFLLMVSQVLIYSSCKQEQTSSTSVVPQSTSFKNLLEQEITIPENHPILSKTRRMLSLKSLVTELRESPNDKKLFNMCGLGWIEGYVIDEEKQDIILFGKEDKNWPNITLDDFITNVKNVNNKEPSPFCSLDPYPENIKKYKKEINTISTTIDFHEYMERIKDLCGPQKVIVGGVPRISHHALVMLNADYHMKQVTQGLVKVPPLISSMDIMEKKLSVNLFANEKNRPSNTQSRFWFNCKEKNPMFSYADNIVIIDSCDIIISTEAQRNRRDGTTYDSGESNPDAELCAGIFTKYYHQAEVQVEEYAQLTNLYRLQAILNAIYFREHKELINNVFNYFIEEHPYNYTYQILENYPALANGRRIIHDYTERGYYKTNTIIQHVSGGVNMGLELNNNQFKINKDSQEINKIKTTIISSLKETSNLVTWTVTES